MPHISTKVLKYEARSSHMAFTKDSLSLLTYLANTSEMYEKWELLEQGSCF